MFGHPGLNKLLELKDGLVVRIAALPKSAWFHLGFPKIRGTFLGVPIMRTISF